MSTSYLVLNPADKFSLSIQPDAVKLKQEALDKLSAITEITNQDQLQAAAEALVKAQAVTKGMESTRVEVKEPVLDAGRRIDAMAKEFVAPLNAKMEPVRKLVSDYHQKEAARIEAERKAEEKRLADAEAARKEEEARIERERQARETAERERLAAVAKAEAEAAEAARIAALPKAEDAPAQPAEPEDPLAALRMVSEQEEANATAEAENARKNEEEASRLAQIEADRISEQSRLAVTPKGPAKVAGIASRTVWKFDVVDIKALYAAKPEFCELIHRQGVINNAIRDGLRECAGLRIYSEVDTHVRARL